jgi:hypothetical protein
LGIILFHYENQWSLSPLIFAVKHGLVKNVVDWPYSTFHRLVKAGVYPRNWAGGAESDLDGLYDED